MKNHMVANCVLLAPNPPIAPSSISPQRDTHSSIGMMELLWASVALYSLPNSSLQRIPTQHQQTPTLKTDPSGKPSVSSRQLYRVSQTETTLCSPPTPYNQRASLTNR